MEADEPLPRQDGIVAEWSPRGFGFIHFNDGRRAYVHNSACGGQHLEVGETVSAIPAADTANPGKWAAHEVHRLQVYGKTQQWRRAKEAKEAEETEEAEEEASEQTHDLEDAAVERVMESFDTPPRRALSKKHARIAELAVQRVMQSLELPGGGKRVPPEQIAVAAVQRVMESLDLPVHQLEEMEEGRLLGTVTEWNPRGFGFLQFSDGRRAYVHNSQCRGEHLVENEAVSAFCVEDSQNPGKWAAVGVQRHLEGEDGVVAEWKEEGGFGFLTMNDGRRAYVHRSAFGGKGSLYVGMKLRVTTKPDPRNPGKWSVAQVMSTVEDATPIVPMPILPVSSPVTASFEPADANGAQACTVTEWDSRGYGFVKADDGRRAYVHNSSCGGDHLQVGELISAHIVPDPQNSGKWAAVNIHRGTLMVGEDGLMTGEQGTVSEWNDAGGYGFLSMDDGRRAYVHRSSFGGKGALIVGSKLMVTTKPDARNPGKWCVDQIKGEVSLGADQVAAAEQALLGALGGVLDSDSSGLDAAAAAVATALQPAPAGEGGTVTDWHESGGYGFLSMDDGRRAYIHRNTFGGKGGLAEGTRLQVTTKPDPRNPGKWCVGQVLAGLSGDQTAAPGVGGEPALDGEEGVVSEWKEEGGYGFLSMADGRRAYIHRNSFGGTGSLAIGMGLQVTLQPDARNPGKWCVGKVVSVVGNSNIDSGDDDEPCSKRPRTGSDEVVRIVEPGQRSKMQGRLHSHLRA